MGDLPADIGPYRIIRKLGEGGMGIVFEGFHDAIERRVAIKFLHADIAMNSETTARFFNEARAVNRVSHQGLVQISDYGVATDGRAYLVMEFLEGETLGLRISAGGPMPLHAAVYLTRQIADALAAAHAKDIIHRDLKPDNVMIIADSTMPGGERTKLLDFGLAKVSRPESEAHLRTNSAALFGTPAYMSPEQCKGAGLVDAKSDVYSLGVVLFEMMSGRHMFSCKTPGEMISHHLTSQPPPIQSLRPELPKAFVTLLHRMLGKEKEDRPAMLEVVAALDALRLPPPQAPARRPSRETTTGAAKPNTDAAGLAFWSTLSGVSGQRAGHHRLLFGGVLLGLLVIACLFALRFLRDKGAHPSGVAASQPPSLRAPAAPAAAAPAPAVLKPAAQAPVAAPLVPPAVAPVVPQPVAAPAVAAAKPAARPPSRKVSASGARAARPPAQPAPPPARPTEPGAAPAAPAPPPPAPKKVSREPLQVED